MFVLSDHLRFQEENYFNFFQSVEVLLTKARNLQSLVGLRASTVMLSSSGRFSLQKYKVY